MVYSGGPGTEWGPGSWNVPAGVVLAVEAEYGFDAPPRPQALGPDPADFEGARVEEAPARREATLR